MMDSIQADFNHGGMGFDGILSSLIFVPLFGSIFLVPAHQPATLPRMEAHPRDESGT